MPDNNTALVVGGAVTKRVREQDEFKHRTHLRYCRQKTSIAGVIYTCSYYQGHTGPHTEKGYISASKGDDVTYEMAWRSTGERRVIRNAKPAPNFVVTPQLSFFENGAEPQQ